MPPDSEDWEAAWRLYLDTQSPGLVRHPGRYLDLQAARAALDWLANRDLVVVGVDCFVEDGEGLRATDHIADFSSFGLETSDRTKNLLETRGLLTILEGEVDWVDLTVASADQYLATQTEPIGNPPPDDLTDDSNWHGGFYELAIDLGHRDDGRQL